MAAEEPATHANGDGGDHTMSAASKITQRIRSIWPRGASGSDRPAPSDETTPLLARDNVDDEEEGYATDASHTSEPLVSSASSTRKSKKRRIPTIIALIVLSIAVIVILGLGFAAPEAMQEYAEQAAVFEPTKLSIDSFTTDGVNARIQGDFYFNSSRVQRQYVKDIGRSLSWLAKAAETRYTYVTVSLPEYNIDLGRAVVPPVVVSLKDREKTSIDLVVKITPGDPAGLKQIVSDWIDGRLGQLRLKGTANVALQSGILPLGTQTIVQTLTFKDEDVPTIPKYNISKIKVHERKHESGLAADVSISAFNEYPVSFAVPPVAFEIMVPGCVPDGTHLILANASTETIQVEPQSFITVEASGTVSRLSDTLISACPDSTTSPLDDLLRGYIRGDETTVYVRGSRNPHPDTPLWIAELLQSMVIPIPFTGDSMDDLIRNFTMEDTHFSLPNPLADPNTPEAQPRISTEITVLANLPDEINFPIKVSRVRSIADVFYNRTKFGVLELREWQDATSHIIGGDDKHPRGMAVKASIHDAPLGITDQDTFTEVIQGVLFGDDVTLDVEAAVDIEISTALGTFIIRGVPGQGKVPLKPLIGDGFREGFEPNIGSLEIKDTTLTTLRIDALLNVTNPTKYSAKVPYVDINLLYNGTIVANISLDNVHIVPDRNLNLPFTVIWDPIGLSDEEGADKAFELLSRHISGYNTSISVRTHAASFPSIPLLGAALSSFELKIPMPSLARPQPPRDPDDGDDDGDEDGDEGPHFIDEATMHLWSSTADFILLSPFQHTTLFLTWIDARAFYNKTDPIGNITYDLPIEVPPGATQTPRLPVDWRLGGVGYDAVKEALGGTLKLGAKANVTVRIENWVQNVHFEGGGIGAHIKL